MIKEPTEITLKFHNWKNEVDRSNVLPLLVREFSNECECKKTVFWTSSDPPKFSEGRETIKSVNLAGL